MAEQHERPWGATVRRRVLAAAVLFAIWGVVIEGRLIYLQIHQHDSLEQRARDQANRESTLEPRRGDIVDRTGRTLALSVDAESICVVPSQITDPAAMVDAVCAVLGDCTEKERADYLQRVSQKKRDFAYLRRKVTREVAELIKAQDLPTLYTKPEPKRFYPNATLASHVLGYLNLDNAGVAGVEQSYNSKVSGTPGRLFVEVDSGQRAFSRVEQAPVPGDTLELTIDANLQSEVERYLAEGVELNKSVRGSAVVMDPRSGEIYALASYPPFDPNNYLDATDEARRNRAVQEIYEPGSTFKVVTASAAIEEGLFTPSDMLDASAGVWRNGSRVVPEALGHNYGVLSFTDVLVKSSNVGAIKIGTAVGPERMGRYVQRFGFGKRTACDLPGESPGRVTADPPNWRTDTLASVSMGYEIGVTPVQMAAAVSAVANGGLYMQPRLVRALRRGTVRSEVTPQEVRRAVSAETAATLVTIMEQVVERGTGGQAKLNGYTVAGKTGTASMLVGGRYSKTDNYTSFVGFLPSRQPALTILVVVDAPHAGRKFGGDVAAPIFHNIALAAVQRFGIAPTINPAAPVLVRVEASTAPAIRPAVNATASAEPDVVTGPPTVPDVRGLALREAVRRLTRIGLVPRVTGAGVVIDQEPAAGAPIEPGRPCRLFLDRVLIAPSPALPPQ